MTKTVWRPPSQQRCVITDTRCVATAAKPDAARLWSRVLRLNPTNPDLAYRLLIVEPSGPRPGGPRGAADSTRRGRSQTRVSRALARGAACGICRYRDLRRKRAP